MRSFALILLAASFLVAATALADLDGDGVPDAEDNCKTWSNPAPLDCDTDNDGYGNVCDGDFDNDYFVFPSDYAIWIEDAWGIYDSGVGTDMDCDGYVFRSDWDLFHRQQSAVTPGPSGLACAGSVPCPQ